MADAGSLMASAKERTFTIGDMEYATKIWGDPLDEPVLALHGWLDNAASFDVLAPLMDGCCVVAVDLAGHGLTSHRPYNGSYLIWSDLLELLSIADELGWNTFNVLGHSRGAMISTLLSIAAPDRIRRLVTLDCLMPGPSGTSEVTKNLRKYIRDERKYLKRKHKQVVQKPFDTIERAVKARQLLMPMEAASAERILTRGARAVEGGFIWRHDERLKGRSAVKFSKEQNAQLLQDLEAETLCIYAEGALSQASGLVDSLQQYSHINLETVEGNHHFHMEEQAPWVAERIASFLLDGAQ